VAPIVNGVFYEVEERCFICGPCQDVIGKKSWRNESHLSRVHVSEVRGQLRNEPLEAVTRRVKIAES
jgi:hypothetical protein